MGSGGTEFATKDDVTYDRLRQKTKTVATGTYVTAITDTYPGEAVYTTDTSSNFVKDKIYNRIHDNSAWYPKQTSTGSLELNTEESSTSGDQSSGTISITDRWYGFITLPTTYSLYVITGIECAAANGFDITATMGVDLVDSVTPTQTCTPLVALGQQITVTQNTVGRTSVVASKLIRGGTLLGVWASNTGTGAFKCMSSTLTYTKTTGYITTPSYADNTAWTTRNTANQNPIYLKLYYRGYS